MGDGSFVFAYNMVRSLHSGASATLHINGGRVIVWKGDSIMLDISVAV